MKTNYHFNNSDAVTSKKSFGLTISGVLKIFLAFIILAFSSIQNLSAQAGTGCNGGNELANFTGATILTSGYLVGVKMTLPASGKLTGLSLKGNQVGSNVKMGLYADSGGVPGALLATSSIGAVVSGTTTLPVTPINVSAGNYWIMAVYSASFQSTFQTQTTNVKTIYYTPLSISAALPANASGFISYAGADFQYWMNVTCGPNITSFTPTSVCASGTSTVVITGSLFTGATAVTVGGTNVTSFVVNSATQITAQVPPNAIGVVAVTTPTATGTSAATLSVNAIPATQILTPGGNTVDCVGPVVLSRESSVIPNLDFSAGGAATYGNDVWQTFVPNTSGLLTSLSIRANALFQTSSTFTIYGGAGITGPVLYSSSVFILLEPGEWFDVPLPNLNFIPGTTYTFRFSGGSTLQLMGNESGIGTSYTNVFGNSPTVRISYKTTIKPSYSVFQWYNNNVAIPGATASTYNASFSGAYTVKASNGGCLSAASNTANVITPCVPTVSSFSPPTGCVTATSLVITGTYFTGATAVKVGGVNVTSYVVNSATQITAQVAANLSGAVTVTIPGGTGTSATSFSTVTPLVPTVSPSGAVTSCFSQVYTASSVSGTLGSVQWFNNGVAINGATALTYTATAAGTYTCKSLVGSCYSTASNSSVLTLNFSNCATITSFTPSTVCASNDTSVTINGTGFTGATAVKFGGTNAASFVVNSNSQITAIVGAGATGTVSVIAPSGSPVSAASLTVNPAATLTASITPTGSISSCTAVLLTSSTAAISDLNFPSGSNAIYGSDMWQTFVPAVTGQLGSLMVRSSGCFGVIQVTLKIYSGSGIGGTLLHTQTANVHGNCDIWNTITLPAGINLTTGATYTFRIQQNNNTSFLGSTTTPGTFYSSGNGLNPGYGMCFQTFMRPAAISQWFNNGAPISGATGTTYSATTSGNYTFRTSNGTCYSQPSNTTALTINYTNTLVCPGNQVANVSAGTCSAAVSYTPTTTGTATLSYVFSGATTGSGTGSGSGFLFNKGLTTVTLTYSAACGTTTCSFTVMVTDNINPTITAPANVNSCVGYTINIGTPVTSDNCAVATVTNNAPTTFPIGVTTVLWTVTDSSGLTATATQTVTVNASPSVTTVTASPSSTCAGSPVVLTASASGGLGKMLSFTGTNRAQISNLNISPAIVPYLTISTWVKRTGPVSTFAAIVSNDDGGYDRAIMVAGDGNYHIFAGSDINTGVSSVLNQWDFISVYWSATAVTMWKNGVQIFTTTGETASASTIGTGFGQTNSGNWPLTGSIDQVSFWIAARTPSQLVNEMSNILGGNEAGLIGYYKCDEGTGATTADTTANARTATLVNSPVWGTATEPAVKYLWSPGGSTLANPTVSPTVNTSYTVTVTNGVGCSVTSAATIVTINSPTITCGGNKTGNTSANSCNGIVTYAAPTLGGSPVPSLTYVFTGATTGSGTGSGSGALFNKGVTTVTLYATNSCGTVNCSFTVTVIDNVYPSITAPGNLTVCPDMPIVLGTPITSDNCGVASSTNNAPANFPVGTTTITWSVTDTSGNVSSATSSVTVLQTPVTPNATATPANVCPGGTTDLSVNTATIGFTGAYSWPNWTAYSDGGGYADIPWWAPGIVIQSGNSGYSGYTRFSKGILSATADTTITFNWDYYSYDSYYPPYYSYYEPAGYEINGHYYNFPGFDPYYTASQSGSATIVVPAGQTFAFSSYTVNGTNGGSYVNIFDFTAATAETINWYTAPTGGTPFGTSANGTNLTITPPAGVTSYFAEVASPGGCVNPVRSEVTVTSGTFLTLTNPGDQTIEIYNGTCYAYASYNSPLNQSGVGFTYEYSGATTGNGSGTGSGNYFNKGVTTVTIYASNNCAAGQCSFTITVIDTTAPTIATPPNIIACLTSSVILGTPITSDNCTVSSVTNNAPQSYPVGVTNVTWTVTDASGNQAAAVQTVTILPLPASPVASATPAEICMGQTSNLSAPSTGTTGFTGLYAPTNWTILTAPGGSVNTSGAPASISIVSPNGSGAGSSNFERGILSPNSATMVSFNWSYTSGDGSNYDYPQYSLNGVTYAMPGYSNSGGSNQNGTASLTVPAGQSFGLRAYSSDGDGGSCTVVFSNFIVGDGSTAIKWYSAPVGGTLLGTSATGANFTVTPTQPGANLYYAEAVTAFGCPSAIRTVVTVTVKSPSVTCIANQTANATSNCNAIVNYGAPTITGTPAPALSYVFSGATTGVGTGNGSGSTFNIGVTTVTITATNSCGISQCSFTVTVADTTAPTIGTPLPVYADANQNCSAILNLAAPAVSDNCSIASIVNNAPSVFLIGTTVVVWTATDLAGNISTATQTVVVADKILPTVNQPQSVTVSANVGCTASVSLPSLIVSDNCGINSVINNAPLYFPIGNTIVTWTVTDIHGNSATVNQSVTVIDTTIPIITQPANIMACQGQLILGTPVTSDNCSVASVTNNAPANFPIGTTTVTWTVTDTSGNSATASQLVTINANTTYYADADHDGYGNSNNIIVSCNGAPDGYVADATDCDDSNILVHSTYSFYTDTDGDGYGTGVASLQCAAGANIPPLGFAIDNTDCNDNNPNIHQSFPFYVDADGDAYGIGSIVDVCTESGLIIPAGYSTNNSDCNDSLLLYTDADGDGFGSTTLVACDGVENNSDCDDAMLYYIDFDGDGYGNKYGIFSACSGVTSHNDCNDYNSAITLPYTLYRDYDHDGYGDNAISIFGCEVPMDYVSNNTDCDDTHATAHPGAAEVGYDLIDNDCDGLIDEGFPPKVTSTLLCNYTLDNIDTYVYAANVPGATGYRWRVTTMSGPTAGQVQFIDTPLRAFRITQLGTYAFATTYKIEVGVYYAGFLQPYTATNCTVSTPATATQLTSCAANATLGLMSDVVYANNVPFAAGYRFMISDPSNPSNTQELFRATREFRMTLVTNFQVQYNHLYTVKVSIKNTDGSYLPYPAAGCNLTTPVFPTVGLQDSQCDAYVVPSNSTQLFATSYSGAIRYVFQLKGGSLPAAGITVTKQLRSFTLNDFSGQLTPGTVYNVRVRLVFNTSDPDGQFGKTCSIVTPASARAESAITKDVFAVTAYPNPFADNVNIDIKTASVEKVNVKVYDMTGRLLEVLNSEVSEVSNLQIGDRYPSGVYNLIVSQGEEVKTLRVIKR